VNVKEGMKMFLKLSFCYQIYQSERLLQQKEKLLVNETVLHLLLLCVLLSLVDSSMF
jgi:hypothetical protein